MQFMMQWNMIITLKHSNFILGSQSYFLPRIGVIKLLVFAFLCENKANHSFPLIGIKLVWCAIKPIFGGKVSNSDLDSGIAQSIILFIWSLCGSVIWIYYRSQITALLSISNPGKPFHDWESMANTNWRYIVYNICKILHYLPYQL